MGLFGPRFFGTRTGPAFPKIELFPRLFRFKGIAFLRSHMPRKSAEKLKAEYDALEMKARFDQLVPDEETAVDIMFQELERRGFVRCRSCRSQRVARITGQRDMTCLNCNTIDWFTADTFFHHAKQLRPWLFFFALAEKGIMLSSLAFSRIAEIAFSSSWRMHKKAEVALVKLIPRDAASISTSAFIAVFCKRSRLTPAEEHPSKEEDHAEQKEESREQEEDLPPEERRVFNLLGNEPTSFDKLCETTQLKTPQLSAFLSMLEMKGLAQCLGDNWRRSKERKFHSNNSASSQLCKLFVDFVRRHFHGISRKYVQPYLATFWRYRDEARWRGSACLDACLMLGKIELADIMSYVSPRLVSIVDGRLDFPLVPLQS